MGCSLDSNEPWHKETCLALCAIWEGSDQPVSIESRAGTQGTNNIQ